VAPFYHHQSIGSSLAAGLDCTLLSVTGPANKSMIGSAVLRHQTRNAADARKSRQQSTLNPYRD
jgi:hypothetical protein